MQSFLKSISRQNYNPFICFSLYKCHNKLLTQEVTIHQKQMHKDKAAPGHDTTMNIPIPHCKLKRAG